MLAKLGPILASSNVIKGINSLTKDCTAFYCFFLSERETGDGVAVDRSTVQEGLLNSEEMQRLSGQPVMMFPYTCGSCCYCGWCRHFGCVEVRVAVVVS